MQKLHCESVDRLFQTILSLQSLEECYAYFEDLCTIKELQDMAQRLDTAILLSEGCEKVYVIQNLDNFTGETKLVNILKAKDNVEFIMGTVVTDLIGKDSLRGIRLESNRGQTDELKVDGMFVAIGLEPCNTPFEALAPLNAYGYFDTDEACTTDTEGLFVAGDCRSKRIRQVVTASADGAIAAMAACRYLD